MVVVLTHRKLLLTNWDKLVVLLGYMCDLMCGNKSCTMYISCIHRRTNTHCTYTYSDTGEFFPLKRKSSVVYASFILQTQTNVILVIWSHLTPVPQHVHFYHRNFCLSIRLIKYRNTYIQTSCTVPSSGPAKMNGSTFSGLCCAIYVILPFTWAGFGWGRANFLHSNWYGAVSDLCCKQC